MGEKELGWRWEFQEPSWKALTRLPALALALSCIPLSSPWYLGSWLQRRHKVFDHFGFRDCDSADHKKDQERVVAGMRPAHLQNKPPRGSDGPQCRALCGWVPPPLDFHGTPELLAP